MLLYETEKDRLERILANEIAVRNSLGVFSLLYLETFARESESNPYPPQITIVTKVGRIKARHF